MDSALLFNLMLLVWKKKSTSSYQTCPLCPTVHEPLTLSVSTSTMKSLSYSLNKISVFLSITLNVLRCKNKKRIRMNGSFLWMNQGIKYEYIRMHSLTYLRRGTIPCDVLLVIVLWLIYGMLKIIDFIRRWFQITFRQLHLLHQLSPHFLRQVRRDQSNNHRTALLIIYTW